MKVFPLKVRGETASVYLTQGALVVRWEYLGNGSGWVRGEAHSPRQPRRDIDRSCHPGREWQMPGVNSKSITDLGLLIFLCT